MVAIGQSAPFLHCCVVTDPKKKGNKTGQRNLLFEQQFTNADDSMENRVTKNLEAEPKWMDLDI